MTYLYCVCLLIESGGGPETGLGIVSRSLYGSCKSSSAISIWMPAEAEAAMEEGCLGRGKGQQRRGAHKRIFCLERPSRERTGKSAMGMDHTLKFSVPKVMMEISVWKAGL